MNAYVGVSGGLESSSEAGREKCGNCAGMKVRFCVGSGSSGCGRDISIPSSRDVRGGEGGGGDAAISSVEAVAPDLCSWVGDCWYVSFRRRCCGIWGDEPWSLPPCCLGLAALLVSARPVVSAPHPPLLRGGVVLPLS